MEVFLRAGRHLLDILFYIFDNYRVKGSLLDIYETVHNIFRIINKSTVPLNSNSVRKNVVLG